MVLFASSTTDELIATEIDIVLGLGFLLTAHDRSWDPRTSHHLAAGRRRGDARARPRPPAVGDRRRHRRRATSRSRIASVTPSTRSRTRSCARPTPRRAGAPVRAQARAHRGPSVGRARPRDLQPADEPRPAAHRRRGDRLLPRRLRPHHPPDRRARQLPRARGRHARRVPDPGQQQPVGDHEAADRGDGHRGRRRGRGGDLRHERGRVGARRRRDSAVLDRHGGVTVAAAVAAASCCGGSAGSSRIQAVAVRPQVDRAAWPSGARRRGRRARRPAASR